MEGDLRDKQLAAALRSIGRKRRTGILTVQGREEIIAFSFSDGSIVGADALNQSLEHGLGEVLSSQGLSSFPYLAARGNIGLYVCKGIWISGINPVRLPSSPINTADS